MRYARDRLAHGWAPARHPILRAATSSLALCPAARYRAAFRSRSFPSAELPASDGWLHEVIHFDGHDMGLTVRSLQPRTPPSASRTQDKMRFTSARKPIPSVSNVSAAQHTAQFHLMMEDHYR